MPWCLAIREAETERIRLLLEGDEDGIAPDDPKYGDVHIVPFTEDGDEMLFGIHDFTQECYCRPKIQTEPGQRIVVIHEERLPN